MMADLFWKTSKGVKALLATPFKSEEELERIVFENSELLEDIFLLKRQVRGGSKSGIPDIIGIDSDGNICILEMKNCAVDAAIIPQVLQYAFWAESNPDSIKSLWLECGKGLHAEPAVHRKLFLVSRAPAAVRREKTSLNLGLQRPGVAPMSRSQLEQHRQVDLRR